MNNRPADPADLTLLEQHIFNQNRRLIEASASLDRFCKAVPSAIEYAEQKAQERNTAIKWAGFGVMICAVFFGGAGYVIRMGADAANISQAKELVIAANARADAAVAAADAAKASAAGDIEKQLAVVAAKSAKHANLGQKFYEADGEALSKCKSKFLQSFVEDGVTYCTPIRPSKWAALWGDYELPKWKSQ
jgi:hypothetical protein